MESDSFTQISNVKRNIFVPFIKSPDFLGFDMINEQDERESQCLEEVVWEYHPIYVPGHTLFNIRSTRLNNFQSFVFTYSLVFCVIALILLLLLSLFFLHRDI